MTSRFTSTCPRSNCGATARASTKSRRSSLCGSWIVCSRKARIPIRRWKRCRTSYRNWSASRRSAAPILLHKTPLNLGDGVGCTRGGSAMRGSGAQLAGSVRRTAAALCILVSVTSYAQHSGQIPRVGVLHPGSSGEPAAVQREPFERGLRELGWKPGADVLIDYRYAEGDAGRLGQLARELASLPVTVFVARDNPAIGAARSANRDLPIVMSAGTD